MKMLIKVNPEKKSALKSTWTSRFVRLLIRIFFLPVTIKGDKVFFSWLSWRTLIHFAFGTGVYFSFIIGGLSSIDYWDTVMITFSRVFSVILT